MDVHWEHFGGIDIEQIDGPCLEFPELRKRRGRPWRRSSRGWAASTRSSAVGRERRNARASVADMVVRRRDPVMGIRQIQSAGSQRWPGERGCGEGGGPHGAALLPGAAQDDGQVTTPKAGRYGPGRCSCHGRAEKSAKIPVPVGGPYVVERSRRLPNGLSVIAGHVQVRRGSIRTR